ncbi:unnamed protein product [Rhizoctonia solani]|uniref:F-box domain-containing protein n=1 Tax=Rhizoctonia solani TaxID=456999 RepID=A0A8H3CIT6_9AGAM|nr:unnamed protein product [Rhizoctonia solani]
MVTRGYVGYRYKRKYFRQFIYGDAYPYDYGHGLRLAQTVPRDPSDLKDWVANRIHMLENTKTTEIVDEDDYVDIVHPDEGEGADELGFGTTYDNGWTFPEQLIEWTYVFDLDNMVFTVNGLDHFRLDRMPPDLDYYYEDYVRIPLIYLRQTVDLWPMPDFDTEECQRKYEALQPIVVPTSEWGAPTWDQLSVSQQFSIEITHQWLVNTAEQRSRAYAPSVRDEIGKPCWDILCAATPGLAILQETDFETYNLSARTLSSGYNDGRTRPPYRGKPELSYKRPSTIEEMVQERADSIARFRNPRKWRAQNRNVVDYFWVRGCLVTFCVRLAEPIHVAHHVERLVQRMRGSESVGFVLSSQLELVVVAVDGPRVRHSPVLDICAVDGRPGRATDGRLLLTHLLSPRWTSCPLPWRTQAYHSPPISDMPPDVLRMIVEYADLGTYLALRQVSKSVHSICVANPRVGPYTVLHKLPEFETVFAARSTSDQVKTIQLRWQPVGRDHGEWELREVSSEDLDKLKENEYYCEEFASTGSYMAFV